MISVVESKVLRTDDYGRKVTWYKFVGNSSDTKPTGVYPSGSGHLIANGSRFFEYTTETRYEYSDDNWKAVGQDPGVVQSLIRLIDRSIESITVPDGTTSIGDDAIKNCTNLTSITIPNSVTNIGARAFYGCTNLKSIIIPSSVTRIKNDVFGDCESLENITISDGVTYIDMGAFTNCKKLTNITIPNSVTTIRLGAFYNCTNLTTITVNKPQNSISGAPWGAENATVVWTG